MVSVWKKIIHSWSLCLCFCFLFFILHSFQIQLPASTFSSTLLNFEVRCFISFFKADFICDLDANEKDSFRSSTHVIIFQSDFVLFYFKSFPNKFHLVLSVCFQSNSEFRIEIWMSQSNFPEFNVATRILPWAENQLKFFTLSALEERNDASYLFLLL